MDQMRISRRLFATTGLAFLAAGFVLLMIVGVSSVWLVERNRQDDEWVLHSQTVKTTISELGRLLDQAETGQRGYLLTNDPAYLDPYLPAQAAIPSKLDELRKLTADNPQQQEFVSKLRQSVAARLERLQQGVGLIREGKLTEALALARTGIGTQLMNEVRSTLDAMAAEEQALLVARKRESEASAGALFIVTLVSTAILAVLALASLWLVTRYISELRQAHRRVADLNASLEHQVRERTADLEQANAEIQRFAYIVSHDLRSPLVNVMGFTSELETAARIISGYLAKAGASLEPAVHEAANADLPEAIEFIRNSTAKMDRLIGAILKLSREGRRIFAPEPLDMRDLIQGIADNLAHQLAAAGAEIRIGPLPGVVSDRLAVEQVFLNLLDNAVKYLAPGRPGNIEVQGREQPGGLVAFEIADNGRGIAAKDHERIFELFRRAGVQDRPGEGIGLASVRAIVRRLGGSITCDSVLGRGTTFQVVLPKSLMAQEKEAA